jgi:hypothetical protein
VPSSFRHDPIVVMTACDEQRSIMKVLRTKRLKRTSIGDLLNRILDFETRRRPRTLLRKGMLNEESVGDFTYSLSKFLFEA